MGRTLLANFSLVTYTLTIFATSSATHAAPDQKLRAAAKLAEVSLIDSLKTMVLIENGSGDLAGLAKMAEFLEARLKNMGFTTRREKALAAPDKPPSNGADLVIGTLRGSGKGGIAVILHTLKILNEAGWKDFHTLTVVFNPDEEIGSRGSGELISSLADQHQTVLSFEPTGAKAVAKTEALLLGAAGGSRVRLEVKLNAGAPISATEIRPLQSC